MSKLTPVVVYDQPEGSASLANAIAQKVNADVVALEVLYFADTESLFRIKDPGKFKDTVVFLVCQFVFDEQSTVNNQLLRFLLLIQQLKVSGANKIIVVMPYLPYARQAKSEDDARTGPLQAVGKFFAVAGADEVVACELHDDLCRAAFDIPLYDVTLENVWKTVLAELDEPTVGGFNQLCFLSPDLGGVGRVERLAKIFGASAADGCAYVEKKRVAYDKSVAQKLVGDVKDKTVVMIDDIIDTGFTAANAAELALQKGAKRVFGCFTHAVLSEGAHKKLHVFERIWVTDTILKLQATDGLDPSVITVVSVEKEIVEFVQGLLSK